jgi:hypothetical protein
VEADIALVPVEISLFGAIGISAQADSLAEAVSEFFLRVFSPAWQFRS